MKDYISKSIFFISVLCINTAWAEIREMVCEPPPADIADKIQQDRGSGNIKTQAKDYEYKIKIKYDTDKYSKNDPAYKVATVAFSRLGFRSAGGVSVDEFYPVQTYDTSRLRLIKGKTTYLDNTLNLGGYGARLEYSWTLEEGYIAINPKTNLPYASNEYLLKITGWSGKNEVATDYLKKVKSPPIHDFHFTPGVQICSKWLVNGKEVPNLASADKPVQGVSEHKEPRPDEGMAGSSGSIPVSGIKASYSEFECLTGKNEFPFKFNWAAQVMPEQNTVNVFSEIKIFSKKPEFVSLQNMHFIKEIEFGAKKDTEKATLFYDFKAELDSSNLGRPDGKYIYSLMTRLIEKEGNTEKNPIFLGGNCHRVLGATPRDNFKFIKTFTLD